MANNLEDILITINSDQSGQRIDLFLAQYLPEYSRSYFKNLIEQGAISINGQAVTKSGYLLKLADQLVIKFPVLEHVQINEQVSALKVEVVFEHPDFLIINKPAGLVVHAPQHNYTGVTLVDWLLKYFHDIKTAGSQERPGIVHRLDLHTSGLMIIARNHQSHALFTDLFKNRQIQKTYLAIVFGHPPKSGIIDYHIVRHPTARQKMTHVLKSDLNQNWAKKARASHTSYEVQQYFDRYSLVALKPVTGRTHQIRVHMTAIGHVLIGDTVYGDKTKLLGRQALHAHRLEFVYQGQSYSFESELPSDMHDLVLANKSK